MALKKLLPLVTLLSCLVVLVPIAAFSVVGNRAPDNVLMPDGASGPVQLVSSTFVQGWGFFTRDPTENRTVIYFENEAGVWEKSTLDDPKPTDVNFGLSRVRRAYLADLALILESADRDGAKFIPCEVADGSPTQGCSLDAEKVTVQLQTPPVQPQWCGRQALVLKYRPIPFTYGQLTTEKQSQGIKVRISCG